jgi:hypothetical protein
VFTNNLVNGGVTNAKLATSSVDRRALAFNAVGSSQLINRQVFDDDLRNPIYSAVVSADGTTSTARSNGVDSSQTRKVGSISNPILAGLYTVAFQHDVRNGAVAVTAGLRGTDATVIHSSSDPRTSRSGSQRRG